MFPATGPRPAPARAWALCIGRRASSSRPGLHQINSPSAQPMRRRYYVCGLLFLLITVNYLDRSVLPVAAKAVSTEFHFSPVAMGYLFSSFIWTYALFIFIAGFIVDRFSTK